MSSHCLILTLSPPCVPLPLPFPSTPPFTSIKPYSERRCTDVLFLLSFLASWAVMGYVLQQAITRGDPNRLLFTRGTDMNGDVCGVSPAVAHLPYAAWPYPPSYSSLVCVASCNHTLNDSNIALHLPSTPVLHYCVPDPQALLNASAALNVSGVEPSSPLLQSATTQALSAIGDVLDTWPVILGSAGITVALSFLYLLVLQLAAGALVYSLLALLLVAGGLSGYALLQFADSESSNPTVSTTNVHLMQYFAYALLGLTAIFALVIIALRKRILLAVQVVKEASRAMSAMRSMLLFPLLPVAAFVGFAVGWVAIALYTYSVGSYAYVATPNPVLFDFSTQQRNTNPEWTRQFVWDQSFQRLFAFHFFLFLWTAEFLVYLTFTTLAGAVADWYFTPKSAQQAEALQTMEGAKALSHQAATHTVHVRPHDAVPIKVSSHRLSRFPVFASLCRTLRFHLGTVLAAALIIAIVQMVRAVVAYVQAQARGKESRLQKAVFACVQCCLKCLQTFLDKVNRNALIWSSVYGDNLLHSIEGSFKLIWDNLFRVAAINLVADFLFLLGKVVIAAATAGISVVIMSRVNTYSGELSSLFVPCVVVFILSYVVASLFMAVFSTAVDTVFLCFLVDCQENEKDGIMLASDGLRQLVQSHAQQSVLDAKFRNERQLYAQQTQMQQVQMAPTGQPQK